MVHRTADPIEWRIDAHGSISPNYYRAFVEIAGQLASSLVGISLQLISR